MESILGCKDPYKGDLEKRFEFVKSFGSGGFGTVELCRDRDNDNKLVIRKLSHIESTTINEIAMLYHIRHKYIIKLYDYFQTKIDQATIDRNEIKGMKVNTPMYGMVIEFGEGGDLLRYISERLSIEEIILLKIIDQSAQALQFLNENRTMHRDIKPENILLDKYGDIKLADFGTGDVLQEDTSYRTFTQQTGTQIYMAPEIKAQHKYYTYAIDVYSLGVSIYRACRGNLQNADLKTIDAYGLPEPIPEQYSPQFISLIKKMLAYDEDDRATLPYIRNKIREITTSHKLTETEEDILNSSIKLFYGIDGIFNKEEAIRNFQKLVTDTQYENSESDYQLAQCYLYGDTIERNNEQAIKLLRMASRKLHPSALKTLARCYELGIGVEKDLFITAQLLSIAQKKDPEAGFLLGNLIYNGDDFDIKNSKWDSKKVIKKDLKLAFNYFLRAKNFVPSQNCIGICYLDGKGVEKDEFEAYKYFSSAANAGFLDAIYNLAIFYIDHKIGDQIYLEKAEILLKKAADQFHIGAMIKLYEMYKSGVFKNNNKYEKYSKIANSKETIIFDSIYSFALLKLNGFKSKENLNEVQKNQYEAFNLFSMCAEKNHPGATYRLAQCYRDGNGIQKDEEKSADLFEKASNDGIIEATVDLALCYLNGKGRPIDKEKGIKLIKESIEHDCFYAKNCLAICYMNSNGVEKNDEKSINLFREASLEDDLESIYYLAVCLRKKGLAEMNFDLLEESLNLFEKAASKGHSNASYELGLIYTQGFEIYKDKEKSSKYFEIASEQNHPKASTELGKYYESLSYDEKAFKLYEKSSNLGDKEGLFRLGLCYLNGIGVSTDKEKARNLLEKASEMGIVDAKLHLGYLYQKGIGGPKDDKKSATLFGEASKLGNNEAKVQLGKCYLHGFGVQNDNKMAFKLFKQASDNKNIEGKYQLAKLYLKGIGTFKNTLEAIILFEYLVREKNYSPAMVVLSNCYINGIGCDVDEKKGVQMLKKAVKNGNIKAMNSLGICYLNGTGVKKNYDVAIDYFKKAADEGNKDAIENLSKYGKIDVNEEIIDNNNISLNKSQNNSSVYYMNDARFKFEKNNQKVSENSNVLRAPLKDQRNPRLNARLGNTANNRQQRERNRPPEPIDSLQKSPRRVMIGPVPPLLQKNRSGRRAINQPIQQGQHRR